MSESILFDENFFEETFLPEKIICREGQVKEIARCLRRAKHGKSTKNQHIHGPPGAGKTSVMKWILNEQFEKRSAYVNCWSKRTQHKILECILNQMGEFIHGAESTSKLLDHFKKNVKRGFILCLDECDQMRDTKLLYDLGQSCTLILISNEIDALLNADPRIESRMSLEKREFKQYDREEILCILKDRVSYGFRPGSISDSLLSTISKICNGDARIALQTLKISAINAELKDLDMITATEVREAIRCTRKHRESYLLRKLNEFQRTIYEILKKNKKMDSKELYEKCKEVTGKKLPGRSYRKYCSRMVELGLIKAIGSKRWKMYEIV